MRVALVKNGACVVGNAGPVTNVPMVGLTLVTTCCDVGVPLTIGTVSTVMGSLPLVNKLTVCW